MSAFNRNCVAIFMMLGCVSLPLRGWADPSETPEAPARAEEEVDRDVIIRSARLVVDTTTHTAQFEGDVIVRHGELVLKCDKLNADYNDQGHPTRLTAEGRVRLSRGELFATAESAIYRRANLGPKPTGTIELSGSPKVWRGAHTMSGRSVTIDLAKGRVEVEAPRGVLRVPEPARPSP